MDRYIYAGNKMKELLKLVRKRGKIQERLKENNITTKRRSSLLADLNFISMHIEQEKERIGYALGHLNINDIREEWKPTGFHTYKGIKEELKSLTF